MQALSDIERQLLLSLIEGWFHLPTGWSKQKERQMVDLRKRLEGVDKRVWVD